MNKKCKGCEYLRQVGWDYFCVAEGFDYEHRIETVDYVIIKETPKWCPKCGSTLCSSSS